MTPPPPAVVEAPALRNAAIRARALFVARR